MRSTLLPRIYAMFFGVGDTLCNPLITSKNDAYHLCVLPLVRYGHAIFTATTPIAVSLLCLTLGVKYEALLVIAIAISINDTLVGLGSLPLSNSMFSAILWWSFCLLALAIKYVFIDFRIRSCAFTTAGFLMGLIIFARPDTFVMMITICALLPAVYFRTNFPSILSRMMKREILCLTFLGFIAGASTCIYMDAQHYGWKSESKSRHFIPALNWFRFNIVEGQSAIHGVHSFEFYWKELLLKSMESPHHSQHACLESDWICRVSLSAYIYLLLLTFIAIEVVKLAKNKGKKEAFASDAFLSLTFCFVGILGIVVFSLVPHKEIRFVYDPLVAFTCGIGIG